MQTRLQTQVRKNMFVQIGKETAQTLQKLIAETAQEVRDRARASAPIKTGALRASITLAISNSGYVAVVGVGVLYGPIIEFGGHGRAAHPYFIPAFELQRSAFVRRFEHAIRVP